MSPVRSFHPAGGRKQARIPALRGFTLIEVLVALVILAAGLLGLARLHASALRMNSEALMRSQATQLAYDMSDRIRANPVAMQDHDYNNPAAVENTNCVTSGPNDIPAGCTPAELAGHDMYEWRDILSTALPSGDGMVCIDSTPDDGTAASPACDGIGTIYVIKVWWDDDRNAATADQRFVMSFDP